MADKFFNSNGIEIGYKSKRKQQMREQFSKGLSFALGKNSKVENNVQAKKKRTTNESQKIKSEPKKKEAPASKSGYTKKETARGTMYFKDNLIVSKHDYIKATGETE